MCTVLRDCLLVGETDPLLADFAPLLLLFKRPTAWWTLVKMASIYWGLEQGVACCFDSVKPLFVAQVILS